jgi:UDP-GlcNAc:undecaprenyl-phosphate GlcNAc-1-phosphate transferase
MNLSIISYSILSFVILFLFSKFSYKLNLTDKKSERKIHYKPTAFTGGITISFILLIKLLIFEVHDKNLNLILSTAFLISIVGLVDDRYKINPSSKLSLQILPIFYLVVFENFILQNLGNYNYFTLDLGTFAIPFTLICSLFLINSFNYFDGMDGTLGFSSISVLFILYFLVPDQRIQIFLITLYIPVAIFLFFNFSIFKLPKLFLGDCGSLLLGFIISFFLIYLANRSLVHPILLAWSIVIFVYEFLSINIIRIKNKKDPFEAGLDHLHHVLFSYSKSIFLTNSFIFFINIILFTIGYLSFLFIGPLSSFILFIFFFIIFLITRNKYSKNKINIKTI